MKRAWIPLLLLLLALTACAPDSEQVLTELEDGTIVYSDWSKLEERDQVEPLYSRWYEDYTPQLLPLEGGYGGSLLPYAGVRLAHDWPAETGLLSGLVTRDGVIVTDPVFSDVRLLELGGRNLLLLQQGTTEGVPYSISMWTVAAADGSWATMPLAGNLQEGPDYLLFVGLDGYTLVRADGTVEEYPWQMLGITPEADPMDRLYAGMRCTQDQVIRAVSASGRQGWHVLDLERRETKTVLLEPGVVPWAYDGIGISDGLIAAQAGELWGYLDVDGQWALEPQFSSVSLFLNGYATVTLQNGKRAIVNQRGEICMESWYGISSCTWEDQCLFVEEVYQDNGYRNGAVYDDAWQLQPMSNRAGEWAGRGWFLDWEANSILRGDEVIALPEALRGDVAWIDARKGAFILRRQSLDQFVVLSMDGGILYTCPADGFIDLLSDQYTGWGYLRVYQDDRYTLRTMEGEVLGEQADGVGRQLAVVDGLIYEVTEARSEYRSLAGEVVFSYPVRNFASE